MGFSDIDPLGRKTGYNPPQKSHREHLPRFPWPQSLKQSSRLTPTKPNFLDGSAAASLPPFRVGGSGSLFSAPYAHARMIARNRAETPSTCSRNPEKRLGDGEPFAREFLIPFSLSSKGQLLLRY